MRLRKAVTSLRSAVFQVGTWGEPRLWLLSLEVKGAGRRGLWTTRPSRSRVFWPNLWRESLGLRWREDSLAVSSCLGSYPNGGHTGISSRREIIILMCVVLSPHHQAILQHQLGILRLKSVLTILTLLVWR